MKLKERTEVKKKNAPGEDSTLVLRLVLDVVADVVAGAGSEGE
jgi:hypothetical protein